MKRECLTFPATEREKWPFPRVGTCWMHIVMVDEREKKNEERAHDIRTYIDTYLVIDKVSKDLTET